MALNLSSGRPHYRNNGKEWTSSEMNEITKPDRPSDEELSSKLKRSVQAIKTMRSKIA